MDNIVHMEGDGSFVAALTEAVQQREQYVESAELPALRNRFGVFHTSLQNLFSLLVRKGLIQEDPYKSEQKVSDFVMSEDSDFPESERDVIVGVRLSELDNLLEYANGYCEFTLQSLDFVQLKKLGELVKYISWDALAANSSRPTTRGVAAVVNRMQQRTDSLAASILHSSLGQLRDSALDIVERLKRIRTLQRERYKLEFRRRVLPTLPDGASLLGDNPEGLNTAREAFTESGMAGPFIPELVTEILEEEYGNASEERRQETLKRLRVSGEPGKKSKQARVSLKEVLVDAIRALSATSRSLEAAMERLRDNADVLRSRKRSLGEKLRAWFDRVVHKAPVHQLYTLEFLDEGTGTRHTEEVDLDAFLTLLHKKSRIYAGLLSRSGSLWEKVEKASDDQLYQFLNKELGSVHLISRRAQAFDSYFKAHATGDEKRRLRGVKIELTSIRNGIAKANQLKHEFASRREEKEQLEKLGIKPE